MGNSIPAEIKIEYDDSGGVLRDISQFVMTLGDFTIEQLLEEKHSFGDSWEESLPIGIGKVADIDIGGLYDDTAAASGGPDAIFRITAPDTPATASRTLKVTWKTTGGTKTSSVETYRQKYSASPDRNALTKFKATVRPTGTTTET
jgi:hypothetical protein